MIALGFIGILIGYVLLYSGITDVNPKDEIVAGFHGGHAQKSGGDSSSFDPTAGDQTPYAGSSEKGPTVQRGKMKMLPPSISAHPGILVDAGVYEIVRYICKTFNVKVSSGYSLIGHATHSDHKCGGAADFIGSDNALGQLHSWASNQSFAYVEPLADSMTIGRLGTTGKHVHISFFRCAFLADKAKG